MTPKLLSARNSLHGGVFVRRLPFVAMGLAFTALIFIGSLKALDFVRGIEVIGELVSRKLLGMAFFSLTGFLLLSNVITAISSFYLSRDLQFLLTLPVDKKHILSLKTIETAATSSWMVAAFLPPVLMAYGVSYGAPPGYYFWAVLSTLLFIVLLAGAGAAIAHIMARLFPAKGMRDMLLFMSLVLFVAVYLLLRGAAPQADKPEELFTAIMSFRGDSPALPGYWASAVIWESLRDGMSVDFLYPFALLANAGFFVMGSLLAGSAFYARNLDAIRPKSGNVRASGYFPAQSRAVAYKDIKVFLRDTSQWSQVLVIGALLLVYVYNFRSFPVDALSRITPFIREFVVLINMLMAGLVLSAVAARFVYSSVSLEGQAFWTIKTSPLGMKSFLRSKFLYGFAPLSLVTGALVFLTSLALGVKGPLLFVSLATVFLLSFSISGLGAGMGAMYPKFKYENIASVSMSLGGMAFMTIAFCVVVFTIILEALPFHLYYKNGNSVWSLTALCVILSLAVNFAAFYFPMKMGIKSLERME